MSAYYTLIRVFGRIGLLSFGGPAAQIALMHRELVETRAWLTEAQFLRALSFCMLLPGPEAMQLATYAGWKQRGILGGLISGGLFVLPGAIVMMILALGYGVYGSLDWMQAVFLGVKATVVVIVIEALLKVSKRALTSTRHAIIAALAFVALFFFNVPFPIVIIIAGLISAFGTQAAAQTPTAKLPWANSLRIVLTGALLWAAPIILLFVTSQDFLLQISLFFSKLAVVTFGGAYAVLAYMTQEVVVNFGWVSTDQMMDGLGLAETTPGPLILATQFIAMIAGFTQGGIGIALAAGALTLWVTFVPCFIWIFAGAPLIDWLEGRPKISGALAGITAAVVGVIGNLTLWFALHVFFANISSVTLGPLNTIVPDLHSFQPLPMILAALAGYLLLKRQWNMVAVLFLSGCLGLLALTVGLPL
ncbi:chromate efflux transporter [Yoonia sp. MH D7]